MALAKKSLDYHDLMKSGHLEAWMWPNDRANPIGVCGSCPEMKFKGLNKLTLQLDKYYAPVLYTHSSDLPVLPQNRASFFLKWLCLSVLSRFPKSPANMRISSEKPPSKLVADIAVFLNKGKPDRPLSLSLSLFLPLANQPLQTLFGGQRKRKSSYCGNTVTTSWLNTLVA